jgi:hypothetical protein
LSPALVSQCAVLSCAVQFLPSLSPGPPRLLPSVQAIGRCFRHRLDYGAILLPSVLLSSVTWHSFSHCVLFLRLPLPPPQAISRCIRHWTMVPSCLAAFLPYSAVSCNGGVLYISYAVLPCSLQAIGRCIRHRLDYGAILLVDERFKEPRNQTSLSKWVRGTIKPAATTQVRKLHLCLQQSYGTHWHRRRHALSVHKQAPRYSVLQLLYCVFTGVATGHGHLLPGLGCLPAWH